MLTLLQNSFSTLLDIDKLTLADKEGVQSVVLVLCWILINLHAETRMGVDGQVLVLCWILINLHLCKRYGSQYSFSTLLDIDKLTPDGKCAYCNNCFSTLLDIDKLTQCFLTLRYP